MSYLSPNDPDLGTGSFGLRYDMNKAAEMQEECRKEARG